MSYDTWKTTEPDYYDRTRGIERTCSDCGEPVMVDRGEVYQVQMFCPDCIDRATRRRAIKAEIERERGEGAA
jgi:formylmethanofuran dehydrogenase subunit E